MLTCKEKLIEECIEAINYHENHDEPEKAERVLYALNLVHRLSLSQAITVYNRVNLEEFVHEESVDPADYPTYFNASWGIE